MRMAVKGLRPHCVHGCALPHQDEIFGPLLPVLSYDTIDEAIDFINEREKPLALYVYSNDTKISERVLNETSSGGACVNDSIMQMANSHLPFGGTGFSGMGAYHGYRGFLELTHEKSVLKKVCCVFLVPASELSLIFMPALLVVVTLCS